MNKEFHPIRSIKSFIKSNNDKYQTLSAFKKDARATSIRVVNDIEQRDVIFIKDDLSFVFPDEAKVLKINSIIVNKRDAKYRVKEIEENYIFSFVDGDGRERQLETTLAKCEKFENDADSLQYKVLCSQNIETEQSINVHIEQINNSAVTDFGKAISEINAKMDYQESWRLLKHDLQWKYDYPKYIKFINNVDEAIKNNNPDFINDSFVEKAAKIAGSFLGAFIPTFIDTLKNRLGQ